MRLGGNQLTTPAYKAQTLRKAHLCAPGHVPNLKTQSNVLMKDGHSRMTFAARQLKTATYFPGGVFAGRASTFIPWIRPKLHQNWRSVSAFRFYLAGSRDDSSPADEGWLPEDSVHRSLVLLSFHIGIVLMAHGNIWIQVIRARGKIMMPTALIELKGASRVSRSRMYLWMFFCSV